MDYTQELHVSSLFDYTDFYTSGLLKDCRINVLNEDGSFSTIEAHLLVLANSSEFFFNAFTSGMQEASDRTVEATVNPHNLFPKVVQWMYNGKIEFNQDDLMSLLEITHFYGIDQLENELKNKYRQIINPTLLLKFAEECMNNELTSRMALLYPDFAEFYQRKLITVAQMTDTLTCEGFAEVVKLLHLENPVSIKLITEFYGSYEGTDEEKQFLVNSLDHTDPNLRRTLAAVNPPWVPSEFIN